MQRAESLTLDGTRRFLEGSEEIAFAVDGKAEMYNWIGKVLQARDYERLGKAERGLVKRFLEKLSGRRRAQLTRLVERWRREGTLEPRSGRRRRFVRGYSADDVRLLAELDESVSGPATKCILERGSGRRVRISRESEREWAGWAPRAHLNVGSKREGESRETLPMLAISPQCAQAHLGRCR